MLTQRQTPAQTENQYAHLPADMPVQVQEVPAPAVPIGVQQIFKGIDQFMPMIENATGLNRREIALNLMKTGIKGGSISSIFDSLLGQRPAPEPKFIRYVKIGAVWIPIALFLTGCSIVGVFLVFKGAMLLLGAL
jgi:hypothetical protein